MPRQRTADQKDPETYPEQPRVDSVEAVAFIPRSGQYLLLGACHLAVLWSRSGSISQKDVMTVELTVGDIHATTKTSKLFLTAKPEGESPVPPQSTFDARIGPWMLLCASIRSDMTCANSFVVSLQYCTSIGIQVLDLCPALQRSASLNVIVDSYSVR
jgi:hypothetical protein